MPSNHVYPQVSRGQRKTKITYFATATRLATSRDSPSRRTEPPSSKVFTVSKDCRVAIAWYFVFRDGEGEPCLVTGGVSVAAAGMVGLVMFESRFIVLSEYWETCQRSATVVFGITLSPLIPEEVGDKSGNESQRREIPCVKPSSWPGHLQMDGCQPRLLELHQSAASKGACR